MQQVSVGELMGGLDRAGLRLSLDGEKIVVRGSLNLRHRIILTHRKRDVTLALEGREHSERI